MYVFVIKVYLLQALLCFVNKSQSFAGAQEYNDDNSYVDEQCCTHGESVARSLDRGGCSAAGTPPDLELEPEEVAACKSASTVCCEEHHKQKEECDAGLKVAESKQCNKPSTDVGKNCCEECSLGTLTGESQGRSACGAPTGDDVAPLTALRKTAFRKCCMKAADKAELTTVKEEKIETTTKKKEAKPKLDVCKKGNPCEQICVDDGGKARCQCRAGYKLSSDGNTCKDVNECASLSEDLCSEEGTVCHNTPGSYKCVPLRKRDVSLSCPPGFKRNVENQVCDDINECQLPRPPCPKYLCENTIGGYKCGGKPGRPAIEATAAVAGGTWTTTPAAPDDPPKEEMCPAGFRSGPDADCVDIDECNESLDDCQRLSQYCINSHGKYFCQNHGSKLCAPGFKINSASGICQDINECEDDSESCKKNEVCVNLAGAYDCKSKISTLPKNLPKKTCQEGTRLRPGGNTCEDIDECRESIHLCDQFQNCINTYGGHECRCKNGFELDHKSGSCVDIDECAMKLDSCPQGQHCLNVLGTFTCTRHQQTTTTTKKSSEYEYVYYDSEEETTPNARPKPNRVTQRPPKPTIKPTTTLAPTTTTPQPTPKATRPWASRPTTSLTYPRPFIYTTTPKISHYRPDHTDPRNDNTRPDYNTPRTSFSRPDRTDTRNDNTRPDHTDTRNENTRPDHTDPRNDNTRPDHTDPRNDNTRPDHTDPRNDNTRPDHTDPRNDNTIPDHTDPRNDNTRPDHTDPRNDNTRPDHTDPRNDNTIPDHTDPRNDNTIPDHTDPRNDNTRPDHTDPRNDNTRPDHTDPRNDNTRPDHTDSRNNNSKPVYNTPRTSYSRPDHTDSRNDNNRPDHTDPRNDNSKPDYNNPTTSLSRPDHTNPWNDNFRPDYKPPRTSFYRPVTTSRTSHPETNITPAENPKPIFRTTTSTTTTTEYQVSDRPSDPESPREVNVDLPHDVVTMKEEKEEDGSVVFNTSSIPKNTWTNVVGVDRGAGFDADRSHCSNGYERNDDGECVDIDECTQSRHSCNSLEVCVNRQGGYTCDCATGHRRDSTGWCQPILTTTESPETTTYGNRYPHESWGHSPYRPPSRPYSPNIICELGYEYDTHHKRCIDIDECTNHKASCAPGERCVNTEGGYKCVCKNCGSRDDGHSVPSPTVGFNSTVITVGSQFGQRGPRYTQPSYSRHHSGNSAVTCPWGYKFKFNNCEDVDECAVGTSECGDDQRCENFYGGYSCKCPPGHRMLGNPRRCEDIDECTLTRPCSTYSECVNTVGSYSCRCSEGFRTSEKNDKVCVDVDECSERSGLCEHHCTNAWGGYRCSCRNGYRLHSDNRTCVDVDECAEWVSTGRQGRLCAGDCVNEPGNYRCDCPKGFRISANGRNCIDIDECHSGEANCTGPDVCMNTRGSYHCQSIECPRGYRHEYNDGKHRCNRIQRTCQISDWECLQQPGSYYYNFITIYSKMYLPNGSVNLFSMHGPSWSDAVTKFDLKVVKVTVRSPNVSRAASNCFDVQQTDNMCMVSLLCSLEGPQAVELELTMSLYHRGRFAGTSVAKLVVTVLEYEF